MVVELDRHVFTIRLPPTAESQTDHVYVNWAQLFGEETWCGQLISLQPLTWTAASLTPQPSQRPPASADCWDARRAEWVRSDGTSAASASHAVRKQRWRQTTRGRRDADDTNCAWLIPGGDIDKWRWKGIASLGSVPPPGRSHERGLAKWRIRNGDLFVGPLGGFHGEHHCAHCNAPLFLNETRTKCCVGVEGPDEAQWCAPALAPPAAPCRRNPWTRRLTCARPEAGTARSAPTRTSRGPRASTARCGTATTSARSTSSRTRARVYNCAYAFSSLHATRIKRKGKPVFQLRGAVYYRIAPAMVPPNGYRSSPAPTLCTSGRNLRPPDTSNHPAACLPLPG